MLPEKLKLLYDVIIGRDLMKELQMDVLYSEDLVVWGTFLKQVVGVSKKWLDYMVFVKIYI